MKKFFKTWQVRFNLFLVMLFPFASDIIAGVTAALPAIQQYLPDNWYKPVGLAVTIINVVWGAIVSNRTAPK